MGSVRDEEEEFESHEMSTLDQSLRMLAIPAAVDASSFRAPSRSSKQLSFKAEHAGAHAVPSAARTQRSTTANGDAKQQGGPRLSQLAEQPAAMFSAQHAAAPPGLFPHPTPPHIPHAGGQQARSLAMPMAHVGSGAGDSVDGTTVTGNVLA